MADNITLNAGSGGDTLAADDVTGVWYQRVKLTDGTADGATPIASGNGTSTNALRVTVSSDSTGVLSVDDNGASLTVDNADITTIAGAVSGTEMQVDVLTSALPTGAATAANQATGNASLSTLAGAVSGTEMQVDVVTSALPTGASTAANQTTGNSSLSTIAGAVSGTEMQVDVVAALPAGTNAIGKLAANSGVDIGDVDVTSISAGANLIGDVGISGARTSGGTTIFRSIDLDESEEEVKGTAGQVYWIHAMNLSASTLYLKFYNATAATVVVGTTTPVLTFPLATQGDTNGAGFTFSIPNGIAFGTAITVACTTGIADADTGAPAANVCVVNLGYA